MSTPYRLVLRACFLSVGSPETHASQPRLRRSCCPDPLITYPPKLIRLAGLILSCPSLQSFFGALGCACAIIFTVVGSSYGTAKSAGAIFSSGVLRPDRLMQNT